MWLVAVALLAQSPDTIYVAVDGNDSWSGRLARPDREKSDGPLRTIQAGNDRARKELVRLIEIEAGHYRVGKPLEFRTVASPGRIFTATSSGYEYRAYHRGRVFIDGSLRISNWEIDSKGWWHAILPDVAAGKWNFIQLWVNGERRFRPRSTGAAYAAIADRADPTPTAAGKGFDRFVFKPGDLKSTWHNLHDVEVLAIHSWSMGRMRIEGIDDRSHAVQFTGHTPATADWSALPKGNRYIVENVQEALGKPGEWYLDRPTGTLTYIPWVGETPANTDVEAPVSDALLVDSSQNDTFIGLTFEYTNWVTPPEGHDFPQADVDIPAAIRMESGHPIFDRCTVAHTGGYAFEVEGSCPGCGISNDVMFDLGAGGVKVDHGPQVRPAGSGAVIYGCRLVSGGRLHPAAVGVWIGDSSGNEVFENEIRDFYYTGISVGWTWGYAPTHSGNNYIARNDISQIGQHVLSDMGGIYTLGDQTGTCLDGNVIHDVNCQVYGGWGIYPDEGSTNELIENNIVYHCQSAGFHQHYGKNNLVQNNIFALNGDYEVMRTRAEDHLSFTFDHNIIAWAGGQPFGSNWSGTGFEMKNDLYWRYGGSATVPPQEPTGLVADPLFLDPTHGDFRLRANSPALKLGFKQIDPKLAGPHGPGAPHPVKSAPRAFPDPFAVH